MSPTVFKEEGYRFFFFSREEERMHVHVISSEGEAKFWLKPSIALSVNYGYNSKHIKQIENLIEEKYGEIEDAWYRHFSR